ncbi:hypothetical protein BJX76DRAFT_102844 [Aspergillus varians]
MEECDEINDLIERLEQTDISQAQAIQNEFSLPESLLHDYKLEAPEAFITVKDIHTVLGFTQRLSNAINAQDHILIEEILQLVMDLPTPGHKKVILNKTLATAAEAGHVALVAWILVNERNTLLNFLELPLHIAAYHNHVEVVKALLHRLTRGFETDTMLSSILLGVDATHEDAIDHVRLYRASVVAAGLEASIAMGFESVASLLLPVLLEVIPELNGRGVADVFQEAATGRYLAFSRRQCLLLLSEQCMPRILRESIQRRLDFGEPADLLVSVWGSGFLAHEDVLLFWSGNRGESDSLKLKMKVMLSKDALQALRGFMYSGHCEVPEGENRRRVLIQVLFAAESLVMPKLKERVRDLLWLSLDRMGYGGEDVMSE